MGLPNARVQGNISNLLDACWKIAIAIYPSARGHDVHTHQVVRWEQTCHTCHADKFAAIFLARRRRPNSASIKVFMSYFTGMCVNDMDASMGGHCRLHSGRSTRGSGSVADMGKGTVLRCVRIDVCTDIYSFRP